MILTTSDLADTLYMMCTSSHLTCVLFCVWQRQQDNMRKENSSLQVREWSHCKLIEDCNQPQLSYVTCCDKSLCIQVLHSFP